MTRDRNASGALWPGSYNQPIADRQYTDTKSAQQAELDVVQFLQVTMCVSTDIWMCLLSAAIGGIISFLVLKFWNSPQTKAKRRPKIPVEHDERQGQDTMLTLYSGEWKRFVETKGKKKIEKMSNSSV